MHYSFSCAAAFAPDVDRQWCPGHPVAGWSPARVLVWSDGQFTRWTAALTVVWADGRRCGPVAPCRGQAEPAQDPPGVGGADEVWSLSQVMPALRYHAVRYDSGKAYVALERF